MAELAVMIDGRVYRVACDEGEEVRLGDLAQLVDAKISALRQRFGDRHQPTHSPSLKETRQRLIGLLRSGNLEGL